MGFCFLSWLRVISINCRENWFLHFTSTVLKSSVGLAAVWNEVWNLNVCDLSPCVATDISIYTYYIYIYILYFNIFGFISIYFTYFSYFFHFQTFRISHRCLTCSWFFNLFFFFLAFCAPHSNLKSQENPDSLVEVGNRILELNGTKHRGGTSPSEWG